MAVVTRKKREWIQRVRRLTQAQAVLGWCLVLMLMALLGTLYLRQSSQTATVGRRVQELQGSLDLYKRENALLEQRIAEAQSLETLQAEAARLGFVPARPDDIVYLVVTDYPQETTAVSIETLTATPEPAPPPAAPIETIREALWRAATSQVDSLIRGEASD